jgi:hypothetical protein
VFEELQMLWNVRRGSWREKNLAGPPFLGTGLWGAAVKVQAVTAFPRLTLMSEGSDSLENMHGLLGSFCSLQLKCNSRVSMYVLEIKVVKGEYEKELTILKKLS